MAGNVLRPKQAQKKIAVGNTKFYDLVKNDPDFPPLIKLGARARGVDEEKLDRWIDLKSGKAA